MPVKSHLMPRDWGCWRLLQTSSNMTSSCGELAKIWRAGCIIRASLLGDIMDAFQADARLDNLLLDRNVPHSCNKPGRSAWRLVCGKRSGVGIPVLALNASLAYFDADRSERLPANLTQAQRYYFGAHNLTGELTGMASSTLIGAQIGRSYEIWSEHSPGWRIGLFIVRCACPSATHRGHPFPQGD